LFSQIAQFIPLKFSAPPTGSFTSPSIYKQEEREPLALSHHGAGGSGATLPLQVKVAARLQGMMPLSFI